VRGFHSQSLWHQQNYTLNQEENRNERRRPTPADDYDVRDQPFRQDSDRPQSTRPISVSGRHVPFEGLDHIFRPRDDFSNRSMTRKENATFRRLKDMTSASRIINQEQPVLSSAEVRKHNAPSSALDRLLDMARIEDHEKNRKLAIETASTENSYSNDALNKVSPDELKQEHIRICKSISEATSDLEIWNILQRDVFRPIREYKLELLPSIKTDTNIHLIGQQFANVLTLAASNLHFKFPTSSVQLSILSAVQAIGPTATVLGVSTELYNHALEYTLVQNEDLSRGLVLLQDMDRQAIEPDESTVEILQKTLHNIKRVLSGVYGQAAVAVWQMERNRITRRELVAKAKIMIQRFDLSQPKSDYEQEID